MTGGCIDCPIFQQCKYGIECPGYASREDCVKALHDLYHNVHEYAGNLQRSLADKIKENKELKESTSTVVLDQILQKVTDLSTQMNYHVNGLAPDGYPVKFNTFGLYRFIGTNNSMGLVQGQTYWLTVYRQEGQKRIWIEWKVEVSRGIAWCDAFLTPKIQTKQCPYDSVQLFEKNWKRERSGMWGDKV